MIRRRFRGKNTCVCVF